MTHPGTCSELLDGISERLNHLLDASEHIVPWLISIKNILKMIDECNANLNKLKDTFNFNNEDLRFFGCLLQAIKLNIILDLGIKLALHQCTPPIYGSALESILESMMKKVHECDQFKDMVDLKLFAIEYGLIEESHYDGKQEKMEDLLKYMQDLEEKIMQYEKYILMNQDESLPFLHMIGLKSFLTKILAIKPSQISESLRENVMMEINYLSVRMMNLFYEINFKTNSDCWIFYLTLYRKLAKKKFEKSRLFEISPRHDFSQVSTHLVHQKTRGWLFGKIETWLATTEKSFFYIVGSEGTGKSCLISAFCKLYDYYIINCFVFDNRFPCGIKELIKSISNSFMHNIPEYLNAMDVIISENSPPPCHYDAPWEELYKCLLKKPLSIMFTEIKNKHSRKVIVIDALNECRKEERRDLVKFLDLFRIDFNEYFCILVTSRSECSEIMSYINERRNEKHFESEGINLDSKTWIGLHLTDLEMFFSSCFCDIIARRVTLQELSHGSNFRGFTKCLDNFMKHTAGKFSYAQHMLRFFDESMQELGGQFQKSIISCFEKFTYHIGRDKLDECLKSFAKTFYTYRLKEGNPVHPPPEIFLLMIGKTIQLE